MANQHVVRRDEGWAIRKENAERDTVVLPTQQGAFEKAREIAEKQGGDVLVHGRDGKIRERNTYGKPDYDPPKG
jgi:uncharacterized protein YdaT